MKEFLLLLGFSLVIFSSLRASSPENFKAEAGPSKATVQSITLSGKVTDQETGEELVCARISIKETGVVYYTDLLGRFTIPGVIPGKTTLVVSYISYQEAEITDFHSHGDTFHITLKPL